MIRTGGRVVSEIRCNGRQISEIWLNGKRVWSGHKVYLRVLAALGLISPADLQKAEGAAADARHRMPLGALAPVQKQDPVFLLAEMERLKAESFPDNAAGVRASGNRRMTAAMAKARASSAMLDGGTAIPVQNAVLPAGKTGRYGVGSAGLVKPAGRPDRVSGQFTDAREKIEGSAAVYAAAMAGQSADAREKIGAADAASRPAAGYPGVWKARLDQLETAVSGAAGRSAEAAVKAVWLVIIAAHGAGRFLQKTARLAGNAALGSSGNGQAAKRTVRIAVISAEHENGHGTAAAFARKISRDNAEGTFGKGWFGKKTAALHRAQALEQAGNGVFAAVYGRLAAWRDEVSCGTGVKAEKADRADTVKTAGISANGKAAESFSQYLAVTAMYDTGNGKTAAARKAIPLAAMPPGKSGAAKKMPGNGNVPMGSAAQAFDGLPGALRAQTAERAVSLAALRDAVNDPASARPKVHLNADTVAGKTEKENLHGAAEENFLADASPQKNAPEKMTAIGDTAKHKAAVQRKSGAGAMSMGSMAALAIDPKMQRRSAARAWQPLSMLNAVMRVESAEVPADWVIPAVQDGWLIVRQVRGAAVQDGWLVLDAESGGTEQPDTPDTPAAEWTLPETADGWLTVRQAREIGSENGFIQLR